MKLLSRHIKNIKLHNEWWCFLPFTTTIFTSKYHHPLPSSSIKSEEILFRSDFTIEVAQREKIRNWIELKAYWKLFFFFFTSTLCASCEEKSLNDDATVDDKNEKYFLSFSYALSLELKNFPQWQKGTSLQELSSKRKNSITLNGLW